MFIERVWIPFHAMGVSICLEREEREEGHLERVTIGERMIYRLTERERRWMVLRERESMRVRREETIKTFPR